MGYHISHEQFPSAKLLDFVQVVENMDLQHFFLIILFLGVSDRDSRDLQGSG
jgi:hypothetical protein